LLNRKTVYNKIKLGLKTKNGWRICIKTVRMGEEFV
jgi:hypothetical protein